MTPIPADPRGRRRDRRDKPRTETVEDALQKLIDDKQRDEEQSELRDRLDQLYREVKGDEDEDEDEDD